MADYGTTDRLTGGTATACGYTGGATPDKAVDNNEGSYFEHIAAFPHWWEYDCGVGVAWAWGKLRAKNYLDYGINAFNATGSNNHSDYTTLYSGNMANNNSWQEFPWINSTAYRYLKINVTSGYGAGDITIYEFEAMEMLPAGGGFSGGQPWMFMKDMWERHNKLWTPKGLILPKESYVC